MSDREAEIVQHLRAIRMYLAMILGLLIGVVITLAMNAGAE